MHGFFLLDKVVDLVGGGSVINRAYPVYFFFNNINGFGANVIFKHTPKEVHGPPTHTVSILIGLALWSLEVQSVRAKAIIDPIS